MTPIQGITIVYADNVRPHSPWRLRESMKFDKCIFAGKFFDTPQSERIQWVKDLCKLHNESKEKALIVTNDYCLIRMIELNMNENKFQIYNIDTGDTVLKFMDINPNPTLDVDNYLYRETIKAALK